MKLPKIRSIGFAAALGGALAALSSFAAPQYHVELTMSGYAGTAALENFPVLVKFARNMPGGFEYAQLREDAIDLSFEDENGSRLPYEIDEWNTSGTSYVWVCVPSLTKATKITAKWGDGAVTAAPAERQNGAAWKPANYAGVWHMGETENQGTTDYAALDSSGNGMTAVPMAGSPNGLNADVTQMVSHEGGAVGRGRVNLFLSNGGKGGNALEVKGYADIAAEIAETSEMTVSGWFYVTTYQKNARIFGQKDSYQANYGWEVQLSGNSRTYNNNTPIADSLTSIPVKEWHHFALVVRGIETPSGFYYDGVEKKTSTLPKIVVPPTTAPQSFVIGNNSACNEVAFSGSYDEVRLMKGSVSADWIKAEYDTVMGAFYEAGPVIDADSFDKLTVQPEQDVAVGAVYPDWGRSDVSVGETVSFSAPSGELRMEDGSYVKIIGYRLYSVLNGVETLLADSDELSGSYTHVAGAADRLVWKQRIRKGGAIFATAYSSVVTVNYSESETLVGFPALFRLSANSPEGFDYADCQSNGADILFTDANGSVIPHEIETWNPEGESLIWVCIPELKAGTQFRFCYGNPQITEPQTKKGDMWDGFVGVWHMDESDATAKALDASANGLDATPSGKDVSQMVGTEGAIGGARTVASTAVANEFDVPHSAKMNLDAFTVGCWLKASSAAKNRRIFRKKNQWSDKNGWEVQFDQPTTTPTVMPRGSDQDGKDKAVAIPSLANDWQYLVWTFDNNRCVATTYANGAYAGENTFTKIVDNMRQLDFMGDTAAYVGGIDEVRFMAGLATPLRLKTDYDTVMNANFMTKAPVVSAGAANVFIVESSGVQCADVVPAWGESAVKGGDVVEFSAPADEQTVSDDLHVRFVGYKLFVTGADGMEALVAEKSETSGTYTHENGTSARLVWTVRELHRAAAEVEHATVTGSGYYPIGTTVEFAATPDDGWRILDWTVNGESVGTTASSIKVQVSGAMVIAPVLKPKATTVAFYGLSGMTAGVKVDRFVNELDADLFSGTAMAVEKEAGAGRIPTYASLKPAHVIYGDATRQSVIAEDPQSVLICPEDGFEFNQGGGVIPLEGLASFIADEDTVTVECFVHTRYAKVNQYATLWSADLGNEKHDSHNLYCPNGSAASAGAKSVALVGAQTGNVGSGDLTGWLDEGWHHVAVVYDKPSQTARLFVDYKDRGSKPMSIQTLDEVTPLYLGAALSNNGNKANNFNGYVSCLRVSRWAIVKEDFMRAAYDVADDGTIALYSPRGMEGTAVGAFGNKKGEKLCSAVVETLDANGKGAEGVALPVYSDDIPGPSIYANAAALAAEKPLPLVKRPMSIAFVNEETNRSSYVRIDNLCTVVSSFEQFTIEFFAKHISSTNVWRTVIAFNMRDVACSGEITKFSIPGASITHRTFQHPDFPVIGTPLSEDTAWHHYALAYDGVRMHIFIDYVDRGYVVVDRAQGFGSVILGNTYNTTFGNGCRQKESFEGKLSTLRVTRGFLGADQFMVTGPRPQSGFGIFVQ